MTGHRARLLAGVLVLAAGCDSDSVAPPDAAVADSAVDITVDGATAPSDLAADVVSPEAGPPAEAGPSPDAGVDATPACIKTLIPSACQTGYDPQLEAKATAYERSFHVLSAAAFDVWADLTIKTLANQKIVETFLQQGSGWDFKVATGKAVTDVVDDWHKTAGLYGGVGIAADAFRYGVLRDQGYPAAEVARARKHLLASLDALHIAKAITGSAPSIARGFVRTDAKTYVYATVPLFDSAGKPLPAEKNNGTWRKDNSKGGLFPKYIWEDSCSRDQLLGWIAAYGAAWEVIQSDATIPALYKQRLQQETRELGQGLIKKQKSGFDLELVDADGRTTYHGYMHEAAFDRIYIPNPLLKNGSHAIMALGIMATLVYVSGDKALADYLDKTLIGQRKLHKVARDYMLIDAGPKSNYSGWNMVFMGGWLAARYLKGAPNLAVVRTALKDKLYNNALALTKPTPAGWKQSLFDVIYAAGLAQASAHGPTAGSVDAKAVSNAQETLNAFPAPPFWSKAVENCDAKELSSMVCTAIDGKTTFIINPVNDRGDKPQSITPVPFHLRPPSNYDWRSNPFRVNGGGSGGLMLTGVDFRIAYWIGRWVRR